MDPKFKPYRTGMLTVKEKFVCGREDKPYGRNRVYYLCQCDCGRKVIFSGVWSLPKAQTLGSRRIPDINGF